MSTFFECVMIDNKVRAKSYLMTERSTETDIFLIRRDRAKTRYKE